MHVKKILFRLQRDNIACCRALY